MVRRTLLVLFPTLLLFEVFVWQSFAEASGRVRPISPRGTLPEKLALLTTPELASLPGAPQGFRVARTNHSVGLFEQSGGQKGPCGITIKLPYQPKTFPIGAGEDIQAASLEGFQYVVDIPGSLATALLTGWQKQNHPGCPSFQSTDPDGTVQTTKLLAALPMPNLVDQAAGSLEEVSTADSSVGIYAFIFREGQRIDVMSLFVSSPVSQLFGENLATLAESRLKFSEGSAA